MNMKNIFTVVLLLFVGFSLVYLFTSGARSPAVTEGKLPVPPARADSTTQPMKGVPTASKEGQRVIAYYFHTTQRCVTCRMIETYAREAIETDFADELEDGSLVWLPVNVQVPDHEHFLQDYQLTSKAVVLVEMAGEERTRWKNLDQVWLLVRDKKAFQVYIQEETRDFLGE
jgi:hypothetical protein